MLNEDNKTNYEFGICGKPKYDKKTALTKKNNRRKSGVELRVYQCESCNAWHLTKSL